MNKTILLIHGRNFKPSQSIWQKLWGDAVRHGIERDRPNSLAAWDDCQRDFIYYGDVSNELLSQELDTAIPDYAGTTLQTLKRLKELQADDFTRERFEAIGGWAWLAEAAADLLSGPASAMGLGQFLVESFAPDIREYWNADSQFGSDVRYPLIQPLRKAIDRGGEILVIAHSLGSMIAYDTFWKFCRAAEYRPQYCNKKIDLFLSLGSPLSDETVKQYLKGARASGVRRYPNNIRHWVNVAAEDDLVAHDETVANDYREMLDYGLIESITDQRVFNMGTVNGESQPHNDLCYLLHPFVVNTIADWVQS